MFFFSAFLVLFGAVFAGIAAFICGIVDYDEYTGDVTFGSTGSGFPSAGGPPKTVLFLVGGLFMTVGFLVVIAGVTAALRTVRLAAWLDGTVVHVRGAYRTRDVDLATAYVSEGAVKRRVGHTIVSTPTLEARDPATGHRLTVPLEGDDTGLLPPNELRALADAMTRGRGDSENDRDVHRLAESLRTRVGSVRSV
ncbi:hypothetical protein [Actinoplanes subglobosus]|uniref:DUF304 domain-containing protein n=1 Tax=Actinoplanes subglobosus TaxID=1547892 RepID=A0ABV8IZY3_9ACTN